MEKEFPVPLIVAGGVLLLILVIGLGYRTLNRLTASSQKGSEVMAPSQQS